MMRLCNIRFIVGKDTLNAGWNKTFGSEFADFATEKALAALGLFTCVVF
jgi:hypothetical protein